MSSPTPRIIMPTLGWKMSHDTATANKNSGIQIISAARKIAKPTIPDSKPPSKGTYPRIVVMGLRNAQIENTIKKYEASLIKFFLVSIIFFSCSNISWNDSLRCVIKSSSLIGASRSAVQSDNKQQQHPSPYIWSLSATPFSAISILKGTKLF